MHTNVSARSDEATTTENNLVCTYVHFFGGSKSPLKIQVSERDPVAVRQLVLDAPKGSLLHGWRKFCFVDAVMGPQGSVVCELSSTSTESFSVKLFPTH